MTDFGDGALTAEQASAKDDAGANASRDCEERKVAHSDARSGCGLAHCREISVIGDVHRQCRRLVSTSPDNDSVQLTGRWGAHSSFPVP